MYKIGTQTVTDIYKFDFDKPIIKSPFPGTNEY
jgi:hypothetical protein